MTSSSQILNVASGIILRETPEGTRVLVARRKLDTSLEPGKWEFPGGKLEPLEHPEDCLRRELREELALEVAVGDIFDVASHVYQTPKGPFHVLLLCYLCFTDQAEFKLLDVADAKWIQASELGDFEYAAADIATVEKLREFMSDMGD